MSYLRQRINFQSGVVSGTITNSQTTISGISFSTAIASGSAVPVVLNPSYYGSTNSPEIIYVTSVSGTVATVLRAQEGTTAVAGTSLPWVAGPLASDFGITNQITNGDFPTPIASGQVLTSTASGINAPVWNTPSGPLASGVTVSGYQIYGDLSTNATISGSRVIGVPNQTITQYTASGTNQFSATLITTQYATVSGATSTSNSSAGKGVILPSITTSGQAVTIDNTDGFHWLLIYPANGQSIDGAGNNLPVWIAPSAYWYGVAENSTNWATVVPSLNSGIGVSSTYGNGSVTLSSALSMSTINAGTPVTLSGFNNYLVLVNGYGSRSSSGFLTTSLNYNGTSVVTANTYSPGGSGDYSLSNMGTVSVGTGSWTATVTNTGYSNGSGFAIVIGIN